jgi:hypothetical protein
MVILYIYSTCWHMKLVFMSANTSPKFELLLILSKARHEAMQEI